MSKNRVETLESTVAELESTVEGLTEELVEAKERIRILEAALDEETPTRAASIRTDETPEAKPDEVEAATAEAGSDADGREETEDSRSDDIIVA